MFVFWSPLVFSLPPDNAYDPDVSAKQIWIDKTVINEHICLTFTDNGNGMNSEKLHKMLRWAPSSPLLLLSLLSLFLLLVIPWFCSEIQRFCRS